MIECLILIVILLVYVFIYLLHCKNFSFTDKTVEIS